ncbi:hypothetical protein [Adhaeretor mobilis]|uniref:Uncharacterized protein n=1 Tax=Adhaeretor mobilis TaxID=1930276 RepID=A0A517MTG7_9BACT|nr:hypothetical protein [Adhaeretor mobilis]QDS98178.1 hypothetical protein HG15A2_14510 [Adhaeretor mobilis]
MDKKHIFSKFLEDFGLGCEHKRFLLIMLDEALKFGLCVELVFRGEPGRAVCISADRS